MPAPSWKCGRTAAWSTPGPCIANAHAFDGKTIITIEGQAKTDADGNITELTPIRRAFIEKFAVQWVRLLRTGGVAGATAFIDGLKRKPVSAPNWAQSSALNRAYRRCTGWCAAMKPCAMWRLPLPAV